MMEKKTRQKATTQNLAKHFAKEKILDKIAELQRKMCEASLSAYMREAWAVLNPSTPFITNWHLDLIAEYLQACGIGQLRRLVINVPPKASKSTLVSVMWPTWSWGPQNVAGSRWMFASYSERVSTRDSLARRTLLTSQWYQKNWGRRVRLIADQNQKTLFQNTARGHMLATTMNGQGTGLGGSFLVIDDPHDSEKVISEKERKRALYNFDQKLYTRLDDRKTGVIVIIMQRLHTRDLSGHVLEGSDGTRWEHLSIPMEAPAKKTFVFPISKREYVREEGALLNPIREGTAELEEHKARLGSYGYAGQFQQSPLPPGGGIFKETYFKLWPNLDDDGNEEIAELPKFTRVVQSWDTAIKDKESDSFSVCTTWGICDNGYFLLDVWREHVEFPEMIRAMHELANEFRPDTILIEDKASGQSAIQELRRSTLPVIAVRVDTDKIARARAAAPIAEAGKIWIKRSARGSQAYLDELCNFPKTEFSDQVDSTTQFINWLRQSGGFDSYWTADNEKVRQQKIAEGQMVESRLNPGTMVWVCARRGCEVEIPFGVPYIQSRGLKFCCQSHALEEYAL